MESEIEDFDYFEQSLYKAFEIGLSLNEYNELTPAELNVKIRAFTDKLLYEAKFQQEMMITQAYLSVYFKRVKKLEPLEKILVDCGVREKEPEQKKEMTNEQMLEVVKALNAKFGGEVVGEK